MPRRSNNFNHDPLFYAPSRLRARLLGALLFLFAVPSGVLAHEPLFMASHEAPGKGAFDLHLEVTGTQTDDEDETEYEVEATWGLTRDVAVRVGLPFVTLSGSDETGSSPSPSGFGDPTVRLKWRFWDRDVLGGKYAVAAILDSTIPVGDEGIGRDRPSLLAGIAHGKEGLEHYYFVDARYAYAVEDSGDKPGDTLFLDASYGWRPVDRGMEGTDVVLFFEANWEDHDQDRRGGVVNPASGGRFFSLAAETLISPSNRLMIRGGVQLPISQSVPTGAPERDFTFRLAVEFRF